MQLRPKVKSCACQVAPAERAHGLGLHIYAHWGTLVHTCTHPAETQHQRETPTARVWHRQRIPRRNPQALRERHIPARYGGRHAVCGRATGERLRRGMVDLSSTLCASRWGKGTLSLCGTLCCAGEGMGFAVSRGLCWGWGVVEAS